MLKQMSAIFSEDWWNFMMIGIMKWPFSQAAINERNRTCTEHPPPSQWCKNEDWIKTEIENQLLENFNINRKLTYAFMDSYSQSGVNNLGDEVQQHHWQEETGKLWREATTKNETFAFRNIDEILKQNKELVAENHRLSDENEDLIELLNECQTSLSNSENMVKKFNKDMYLHGIVTVTGPGTNDGTGADLWVWLKNDDKHCYYQLNLDQNRGTDRGTVDMFYTREDDCESTFDSTDEIEISFKRDGNDGWRIGKAYLYFTYGARFNCNLDSGEEDCFVDKDGDHNHESVYKCKMTCRLA